MMSQLGLLFECIGDRTIDGLPERLGLFRHSLHLGSHEFGLQRSKFLRVFHAQQLLSKIESRFHILLSKPHGLVANVLNAGLRRLGLTLDRADGILRGADVVFERFLGFFDAFSAKALMSAGISNG